VIQYFTAQDAAYPAYSAHPAYIKNDMSMQLGSKREIDVYRVLFKVLFKIVTSPGIPKSKNSTPHAIIGVAQ
jgi:hypothetical protein